MTDAARVKELVAADSNRPDESVSAVITKFFRDLEVYQTTVSQKTPEFTNGRFTSENFRIPDLSDEDAQRTVVDFWSQINLSRVVADMPRGWKFIGNSPDTRPALEPWFSPFLAFVPIPHHPGKLTPQPVFIHDRKQFPSLAAAFHAMRQSDTVRIECSMGIFFLVVTALLLAIGDESFDRIVMTDPFLLSQRNFVSNSVFPRLFKTKVTFPVFLFDLERQEQELRRYPPGTYVYVRGCAIWSARLLSLDLKNFTNKIGLKTSFQGENCIKVKDNLVSGYFQHVPGEATYGPFEFQHVYTNLQKRSMEEINALSKKNLKILERFFREVKQPPTGPIGSRATPLHKTRTLTDIVGITQAYYFVMVY